MIEALPIFPPASLDSSVTTTVWIGVLVVAFFNLRFGWIFSGLVVPGYLVPLILAKPISAVVIVGEAIIVYVLVWVVSERLPRGSTWSSFFGRDRFFLLVLTSVVVRLVLDGWALQMLGEFLVSEFGWSLDYRNELHSFGLVIVALMANQLWKPGLLAGLGQLAVTTGTTLVLVRFVLIEWTNFDLGGLEYMYEDIAASMLASPKAYIILLTTAFIASHLNLRFGWEYSGVLIPALLALQWYQPSKLFASLVEAWVVLGLAHVVLASPVLRGKTIEKAGKLALFFTISYFYKYVLAFGLMVAAPQIKVSDVYGFGYLLPSLLAVKMHEKSIGLRMTRFTLQTTVVSAAIALLVGFGLTLMPRPGLEAARLDQGAEWMVEERDGSLTSAVESAQIAIYSGKRSGSFVEPTARELAIWTASIEALEGYVRDLDESELAAAALGLGQLGFVVERIEGRYLLVRERVAFRGWGFVLFGLQPSSDLFLEVPRPLEEWASVQAATSLFRRFEARAMSVAGAESDASPDGAANVLRRPGTPYQAVHDVMASENALQIRGHTDSYLSRLTGQRWVSEAELESAPSQLLVKGSVPTALDLPALEALLGRYEVLWGSNPEPNVQWASTRTGFAELRLNREDRRTLLTLPPTREARIQPRLHQERIEGYLHQWLLAGKGRVAQRGSEAFVPPQLEDLLFFDEEVLQPIVQIIGSGYRDGELTGAGRASWRQASVAAAYYDYEILWYRHAPSQSDYLLLQEADPPRRFWGTYAFRLGSTTPFVVEVPRPRMESRTFEVGVALFDRVEASALLIAGSHPYANADASADVVRVENRRTLFNLVHQVLLREASAEARFVILCRAFARGTADSEPPAMLALHDGTAESGHLSPLGRQLVTGLVEDAIEPVLVDGSPASAGYEVGLQAQARYLEQSENNELAILWLSSATRDSFRQLGQERSRDRDFAQLGIATVERDVQSWLSEARPTGLDATGRGELSELLRYYIDSADVMALRLIESRWPGLRFERVLDLSSPRAFLLLLDQRDGLAAAINLQLRTSGEPMLLSAEQLPSGASRFLNQRRSLLITRSGP